jgi:hypothetical protein
LLTEAGTGSKENIERAKSENNIKETGSATSEEGSEWIRETLGVVDKNPVKAGSLRNNSFCHRRGMKLRLSFHSPGDHLLPPRLAYCPAIELNL